MVQNTIGAADSVAVPQGHQHIIDEGCAEGHFFIHAQIGGSLHQGYKSAACPGHDVGFCAGIKHLFHVRSEIGGICRSKDIINHKFSTSQRAGIAECCRRAPTKGVVRGDLDKAVVLLRQVQTFVDRILVVVAAGAESIFVEVFHR